MHFAAFVTVLAHLSAVLATTSHIFKDCTRDERRYIEQQLERTMDVLAWANEVPRGGESRGENRVQYFDRRYLDYFQQALHDPPTIVFSCSESGTETGSCQSILADSYLAETRGAPGMITKQSNSLAYCAWPKAAKASIAEREKIEFGNGEVILHTIVQGVLAQEEKKEDL